MAEKKELCEMVRVWAEHAAQPFVGKPRKGVEESLSLAISTAFSVGVAHLPDIKGIRFGYKWLENNQISVAVEPEDELTGDMLILTVGERA